MHDVDHPEYNVQKAEAVAAEVDIRVKGVLARIQDPAYFQPFVTELVTYLCGPTAEGLEKSINALDIALISVRPSELERTREEEEPDPDDLRDKIRDQMVFCDTEDCEGPN